MSHPDVDEAEELWAEADLNLKIARGRLRDAPNSKNAKALANAEKQSELALVGWKAALDQHGTAQDKLAYLVASQLRSKPA